MKHTTPNLLQPMIRAQAHLARTARAWACVMALACLVPVQAQVQAQAPAAGDAATNSDTAYPTRSPTDPWEPFNRKVFDFNESLDQAVIKPVANTYQRVTPRLVQTGLRNFFGNLRDLWSTVNLFLQFKPKAGLEMGTRVLVNSTLGIYGLVDLASPMGLERYSEDFGQTLGRWGVGSGPYLVMPVLGPSTLRDASSYVLVDRNGDPIKEINPIAHRNVAQGLKVVDQRARLLSATNTVDAIAFDRYSFVRDAYLQRRRFQIYDGNPPPEDAKD
mgnify:CR=1 FL=1